MTTPKEALRIARGYIVDDIKRKPSEYDPTGDLRAIDEALASLEGDAVERVKSLARRFWSIHPSTIVAMNLTREEFYAREMMALLATGLVPDEAAVRAGQQSDDAFDIEETRRENADNVRTLDAIADYVGCPHDEELTVDHVRQHYMKLENAAQQQGIEDAGRIANAQAYSAEREAAIRPDNTANLISIIADIREKTGLGGKPMLNELADAIVAEMDRRVADEREKCAKVAESYQRRCCSHDGEVTAGLVAAAIRSGGAK